MQETVSYATAQKIVAFVPTDKQLMLKLKLQRYVSPHVLARLTPGGLDVLTKYLSPISLSELREMVATNATFLEWLVSPDEFDLNVMKAKNQALDVLIEVLNKDDSGNDKITAMRVKAAEAILKQQVNPPSKSTQNLHIQAIPNIPKAIASKSEEELEEELRLLKAQNG